MPELAVSTSSKMRHRIFSSAPKGGQVGLEKRQELGRGQADATI
jgi:hypothetical protein